MTENCTELEIRKMPDGGYIVADAWRDDTRSYFRGPLFASTSIEEALKYIEGKLGPQTAGEKPSHPMKGTDL